MLHCPKNILLDSLILCCRYRFLLENKGFQGLHFPLYQITTYIYRRRESPPLIFQQLSQSRNTSIPFPTGCRPSLLVVGTHSSLILHGDLLSGGIDKIDNEIDTARLTTRWTARFMITRFLRRHIRYNQCNQLLLQVKLPVQ